MFQKITLALVLLGLWLGEAQAFEFLPTRDGLSAGHIRSPQSKADYCAMAAKPENFLALAQTEEAKVAFVNPGGFFNIGLCWWHSRIQRASIYLGYYDPQASKPNPFETLVILDRLYNGRGITRIPGFADFNSFTSENETLIADYLSASQVIDTAVTNEWVDGVLGTSTVEPAVLQKIMDRLYLDFSKSRGVMYQMLQMPGLTAHAWLVTNIEPAGNGYVVTAIDSNFPQENVQYNYVPGMTHFLYGSKRIPFVPYTKEQWKLSLFRAQAQAFCRSGGPGFVSESPIELTSR